MMPPLWEAIPKDAAMMTAASFAKAVTGAIDPKARDVTRRFGLTLHRIGSTDYVLVSDVLCWAFCETAKGYG